MEATPANCSKRSVSLAVITGNIILHSLLPWEELLGDSRFIELIVWVSQTMHIYINTFVLFWVCSVYFLFCIHTALMYI